MQKTGVVFKGGAARRAPPLAVFSFHILFDRTKRIWPSETFFRAGRVSGPYERDFGAVHIAAGLRCSKNPKSTAAAGGAMRQHSRRILPAKRAIKSEAIFLKGVAGGKAPSCSFGYFPSMGKVPRRPAKHYLRNCEIVLSPTAIFFSYARKEYGKKSAPRRGHAHCVPSLEPPPCSLRYSASKRPRRRLVPVFS